MLLIVTKYAVTSLVVVAVSELAKRSDKLGALIASFPLVTIMRDSWTWFRSSRICAQYSTNAGRSVSSCPCRRKSRQA